MAALGYVTTAHVSHRLAWLIEVYGAAVAASTPGVQKAPQAAALETAEWLVDATTGDYLEAASA